MVKERQYTIEFTAQALLSQGLISREQHKEILSKGNSRKTKLQKSQDSHYSRRHHHTHHITAAEVISSLAIEMPGKDNKLLSEDIITEAVAGESGLEYRKIDPLNLDLDVVTSHVPRPFALRHLVIPVEERNGVVTFAVADPFNLEAIESLKTARKIKTKLVLSSKNDILKIVQEFFGFRASVKAAEAEMSPRPAELGNLEQYVRLKGQGEIEATDQHIVNAVEYLLHYAFDQRASDIHIEPKKDQTYIRLRVDGILHYIHTVPKSIHAPIVSRIKMLSRMDIAEKRRPQDGRIKTSYRGKDIEIRVSTLPVAFGEKVVIRIFDPEILLQDLDHLGFYPREFQIYNSFIRRPNGIILVTGPTGSGKTTTLYSTLKALSSPDVNIITLEEPIEMVVEEFNQVGVQPSIGVTFANILRTVLRQDPDIIMVGEIRDRETAENAVQAALTGHLVLTTLHTNDAPSSLIRLLDLGVPSFLLSSSVIGTVAQRLVRKICPHCKKERRLLDEEIDYLRLVRRQYKVFYGEGCLECRGTGYKGRTGVYEVMEFTDRVKAVMTDKVALSTLYEATGADGLISLRKGAVRKMLEGTTTYEEVIAVTG